MTRPEHHPGPTCPRGPESVRRLPGVNFGNAPARVHATAILIAITVIAGHAQTFTTLVNFDEKDGQIPIGPLVQDLNGNFYGTARQA